MATAASEDTKVLRVSLTVMICEKDCTGHAVDRDIGRGDHGGPDWDFPQPGGIMWATGCRKTTKKQVEQSKPIVFRGGQ